MCRLLAYVGPPICCADLLFRPTNSIVRQSFDAKQRANGARLENPYAHGSLNADGFGMAFYGSFEGEDEDQKKLPCVFTELLPAWNSKNLRRLSEKVHAKLFFAHIRAAGPSPDGQVSICDCKTHPFTFGRYSFMHNGEIGGFAAIRRQLLAMLKRDESFNVAMMHGATDTAVAFAVFIDQLPASSASTEDLPSTVILQMLKQTIEIIHQVSSRNGGAVMGQSKLNFVVTDGRVVIATRYAFGPATTSPDALPITAPSLYYSSGSHFKKPTGEQDEFRISHSERASRMTIVSSEPLTEVKGDWVSVPFNHVVVVLPSGETLCGPLVFGGGTTRLDDALAGEAALELDRAISRLEESFAVKSIDASSSRPTTSTTSTTNTKLRLMRMVSSSMVLTPSAVEYQQQQLLLSSSSSSTSTSTTHDLLQGKYGREIAQPFHVLAFSGQVHVSCMARMGDFLFVADGGTTGGKVCWFSLESYELLAWSPSWNILALACCEERGLLFGSRSDGKVLIWRVHAGALGETHAYASITIPEVGHVLTMRLVRHQDHRVLVIGSQDGNLRRINVDDVETPFLVEDDEERARSGTIRECARQYLGSGSSSTAVEPSMASQASDDDDDDVYCASSIASASSRTSSQRLASPALGSKSARALTRSHCGFVTATAQLEQFLFSAGSCSLIKRWAMQGECACVEVVSAGHHRAVTGLGVLDSLKWLLSSSLDGTVHAWRLARQHEGEGGEGDGWSTVHVKTFWANGDGLTCVAPTARGFCCGTVTGLVWVWQFQHEQHLPSAFFNVSASPVNSVQIGHGGLVFVGTKSGRITVWELPKDDNDEHEQEEQEEEETGFFARSGAATPPPPPPLDNVAMLASLKQFVGIPSVSADPSRLDACLKSAAFLRQLVDGLGGEARLVPGNKIPVVLAKFTANSTTTSTTNRPYVFVYGHHDVVDVVSARWTSPPFELSGREAFVFGRGVSDNKGPCLALLYATAQLKRQGQLGVDVMFCFEGENETDMSIEERGFASMLRENRGGLFFPEHAPLLVVLSNNTWLSSQTPCLTYGMRGIVDIALTVSAAAPQPPQHQQHTQGEEEEGDAVAHCCHGGEDVTLRPPTSTSTATTAPSPASSSTGAPVVDLMAALQTCEELRLALKQTATPLGSQELARLRQVGVKIASELSSSASSSASSPIDVDELVESWTSPAVSISAVHTSSDCFRRVPLEATAKVTVHFVPSLTEQSARALVLQHFERAFAGLRTANRCRVEPKFTGQWWVGDVEHAGFKAFSHAVHAVWGQPALLVRSGTRDSSMTCFLEREFKACCVNFPMAGNGDLAHQSNEHIKLVNLYRGRDVFERVLRTLSGQDDDYQVA